MTDHTKPVPSTEFAPEGSWFKSSFSDQGGGNCVEVASWGNLVGVRDSKDKQGPALALPRGAYASFIRTLKDGALDVGMVD
ncbi:DUF397 domain-containing protein [Streptomyces sp. A1499]|jgi:hypothetical protein|uniref:DUF397 domain-containing protein n=1 Tax=Streptomyces sp. A1499 TaxID=2563104 RepID=UPI00109E493A|nr:DUF397 domain-containing protein [Streptomyces sp. A1499]THC52467.1 DUF397 domain-containing protein [Streptomyces sp. A1499]